METTSMNISETTNEQCLQQLSSAVFNVLRDQYGEITPQLADHLVEEVLYQISFKLRQGQCLSLEALGAFIPADLAGSRIVTFHPCPALGQPMPGIPTEVIQMIERRTGAQQ